MKKPDEAVSSGLFGDVSCMYVSELGQGGYFTPDECNATSYIITKPCQCEAPSTSAPMTNAPTTASKKSASVMTGINGAIVAVVFLVNSFLN